MESDQESTMLLVNNDRLRHMFMEFLRTQTTAQAPHIKSKCTPDPEVYPEERSSTEQVHECLESFGIALDLKMTLNLDCMPTSEARIAYTFSRTSGTAQEYIALKIQARLYQD